ncbi:type IV pilus modification PilV family protein [Desulfatitalea tepidiphila]|uniref:type IV pilus modification PilV family protein n=1 Tax=Desulfatitalea tepidiphila TaxID=1185843 RepID=UPI0006B436E5|nr:prepilin-type N-terminal cleavage/methylation domain-containing protein [Desulfatitalea tepidiphila]
MKRSMRTIQNRKKTEAGFTLIETIIAVFVFTVGVLAAASMQISSINGNSTAQSLTQGANVAANQVENLRPLDYMTDADLTEGAHGPIQNGNYTITYNVQRDAIVRNTMRVDVTVNWLERGTPKNLNLVYIKQDII